MPKPAISIPVKVGKTFPAGSRRTLTEIHITLEDWGRLQTIILREAARQLGVRKGHIELSLTRPEGDTPAMANGALALVRRGARSKRASG